MSKHTERAAFLLSLPIVVSLAFWIGSRSPGAFEEGEALATQRGAWSRAGFDAVYLRLLEKGEDEKLRDFLENDMWMTVLDLGKLSTNPRATDGERDGADFVMRKLVHYFYLNPHEIVGLQTSEISKSVSDGLGKAAGASSDKSAGSKKIIDEIRKQSESPLEVLDDALTEAIRLRHERDLKTMELLEQHIKKRNFPGIQVDAAGVTIMMPQHLSGRGGPNDDYYEFVGKAEGREFTVSLKNNALTVNGLNYGVVDAGSNICLRIPGEVFINGEQRDPK